MRSTSARLASTSTSASSPSRIPTRPLGRSRNRKNSAAWAPSSTRSEPDRAPSAEKWNWTRWPASTKRKPKPEQDENATCRCKPRAGLKPRCRPEPRRRRLRRTFMAKKKKQFHGIHITPKAGTHYEVRHDPVRDEKGAGEPMPTMGGDDQKNEKLFAHGERGDLHKHLDALMDAHEGTGGSMDMEGGEPTEAVPPDH